MANRVRIWDLPVRVFHGLLAAGVATAWLTAGEHLALHVFAGCVVGGLLAFRLVWGWIGGRYARFRAFAFGPRAVWAHVRGLVRGDAPRHLGHNPVAAWAVFAVLAILAAVTVSGFAVLGGEERHGPLAGVLTVAQGEALHGWHEGLAWAVLAWLGVHLAGVAKESLRQRENLPLSMVTGHKAAPPATASSAAHPLAAALLIVAVAGGAAAAFHDAGAPDWQPFRGPALADDPVWREACGECHLPYHPSLLPERSWAALMDGQADHFGEDLALDDATAARVRAFLTRNAAEREATEHARAVARTTPPDEKPLRITELPMWKRAHADLDPDVFRRPAVENRGRCEACHRDAAAGTFNDDAMRVPTAAERGKP